MRILAFAVKHIAGPHYAVGGVLREGRGWKDAISTFGGHTDARVDHKHPRKAEGATHLSFIIDGAEDCEPWEAFELKVVCRNQESLYQAFYDWFRPASKDALVVVDGGTQERQFLSQCSRSYSSVHDGYALIDFHLQELANILLTSGFAPEAKRLEMAKPHMRFADERFSNNPLWRAHVIAWCATEALYHRARLLRDYPEFPNRQLTLDLRAV
jgi:hypothetical protein